MDDIDESPSASLPPTDASLASPAAPAAGVLSSVGPPGDEAGAGQGTGAAAPAAALTAEQFLESHGALLLSAELPLALHRRLHDKLTGLVFDAGEWVQLEQCSGGRQRRAMLKGSRVLRKESDVFLVDHAWSFRLRGARAQLEEVAGLAERMAALMCVDDDALPAAQGPDEDAEEPSAGLEAQSTGQGASSAAADQDSAADKAASILHTAEAEAQGRGERREQVAWLDLDGLGITDAALADLQLPRRCPNLVALSLWGNQLEDPSAVLAALRGLTSLSALWLNDNPCTAHFKNGTPAGNELGQAFPQLELLNSKFTAAYGPWAVRFTAGLCSAACPVPEREVDAEINELDLSDRGIEELKPQVFSSAAFPNVASLNLAGNPLTRESKATLASTILQLGPGLTSLQVDIPGPLGSSSAEVLAALPGLHELNGLQVVPLRDPTSGLTLRAVPALSPVSMNQPLVDRVLQTQWQYAMNYRLATEEQLDETAVWYIMDEVGSALRHSDTPNFAAAPFLFMPDATLDSAVSYTLLWPTADVAPGAECTRDFLPGAKGQRQRLARLRTWFDLPPEPFLEAYRKRDAELEQRRRAPLVPPSLMNAGPGSAVPEVPPVAQTPGKPLRVFTDLPQIREHLTRPEFRFVDTPSDADIVWTSTQVDDDFRRATGLPLESSKRQEGNGAQQGNGEVAAVPERQGPIINQFPYEACIVMKHHLAQTVQRAYGKVGWLPETYDIEAELPELVGRYLSIASQGEAPLAKEVPGEGRAVDGAGPRRAAQEDENTWIMKPWNMARSIDSAVVRQLPQILRMVETGPKIAQKYILHPALFRGRKFDLRFFVLLRRLQPLDAWLSDVFWARIANHQYSTNDSTLEDFQTHFTVMDGCLHALRSVQNYIGGPLKHVPTHEFVAEIEEEHNVVWASVDERIRAMLRELLLAAGATHPEMDGTPGAYRALYGVDVMLDDQFSPKLLEVTYCPDCTRACTYDMQAANGDRGRTLKAVDFFNNVFGCLFLGESTNVAKL